MNQKFGHMLCPGCKAHDRPNIRVLVRANEKGTLSYKCDECDAQADYAQKGTQKHADWMKRIERIAAPAEPEAKPAPGKPAAPVPPKPADKKPDDGLSWLK